MSDTGILYPHLGHRINRLGLHGAGEAEPVPWIDGRQLRKGLENAFLESFRLNIDPMRTRLLSGLQAGRTFFTNSSRRDLGNWASIKTELIAHRVKHIPE